jgi:hypothetical protein
VKIKIPLSLLMLTTAIVLFIWRTMVPDILETLAGMGIVYLLLVLSLGIMVMVIGWNGAAMTFPVEKG